MSKLGCEIVLLSGTEKLLPGIEIKVNDEQKCLIELVLVNGTYQFQIHGYERISIYPSTNITITKKDERL